ncbi:MAG: hypothetical protein WDZ85_03810 [Candidatus Paceibacterota bacterium]
MTTQELEKLNRLEKEVKVLKTLVANIVPFDNEGEYKKSFENEMKKLSKEKTIFEYSEKGSLIKNLA